MLVGSWTHSSSKGVESFNVASKYFKKHGAVGASIGNLLGKDNGLYVTNIGFENWAHFGDFDDKISNDEQWGKDMDPYFSETKWETMNFYEHLIHNMESDAGVKPVFAQWLFFHEDMNMIQERGDDFIKACQPIAFAQIHQCLLVAGRIMTVEKHRSAGDHMAKHLPGLAFRTGFQDRQKF